MKINKNYSSSYSSIKKNKNVHYFKNNVPNIRINDTTTVKPLIDGKLIFSQLMQDISDAKDSIEISVFAFSRKDIADALIKKKKEGVDVKVIIDPNYYKKDPIPDMDLIENKPDIIEYLQKNNIEVVKYPIPPTARRLFHPKVVIIDNKKAIITGTNFTDSGFDHHDYAVEIKSKQVADLLKTIFNKDYDISKEYAPNDRVKNEIKNKNKIENIKILETDDYNDVFTYKQTIYETLKKAKKSIHLELYALTDKETIKLLIKAKERGVDVKVILDKSISQNRNSAKILKAAGIPVKFWKFDGQNFNFMHAKLGLIDDNTILGSGNWSLSGLNYNREIGVKIKNNKFKNYFEKEFKKDWNISEDKEPPFRKDI